VGVPARGLLRKGGGVAALMDLAVAFPAQPVKIEQRGGWMDPFGGMNIKARQEKGLSLWGWLF